MMIYGVSLPDKNSMMKGFRELLSGSTTKSRIFYVCLIGVLLGAYAVVRILFEGHGAVTNTSNLVPWGIQITTYVYLVLISTGCTFINFFGYTFYKEEYAPFGTRLLFLGIFTALIGMIALSTELGRVDRMIYFILSPQPKSPMWWMSVWYSLYVTLIIIEFINHKRGKHSEKVMWAAFIVAIITHSTLGSLFGMVEQRPYYYSALLPIYFLLIAFLSGAAVATIVVSTHYYKSDDEFQKHVRPFRNSIRIGLGLAILTTFWRLIEGVYAQSEGFEIFRIAFTNTLLFGLLFSLVLPFIVTFFIRCQKCMIGISLFIMLTQFKTRHDLVMGGFQIPVFKAYSTPDIVTYTPSHVEFFVVIASISLVVLLYQLADKTGLLPEEDKHEH